jgi:two-component system sensor histidine kinase HydH
LGLISFLALGGILLFVVQERNRSRIDAEYRSFQIASELLQAYDSGSQGAIARVDGLESLGIYSFRGDALFTHGSAPASIRPEDARKPVRIEGDRIILIRPVGGTVMMRGSRLRGGREGSMENAPAPLIPMMGMGRFVYIEYRASRLFGWPYALYGVAVLVALALILAFLGLLYLARNLDAYRAQEARNRELIALGEVARTLSHEIKNPLGVLKIQCALLRRTAPADTQGNIRIIEEETERLARMTDKVRLYLTTNPGKPEPFALAPYLRSFADRYAESLVLGDLVDDGLFLQLDKNRMAQVLDNLVSNALESMEGLAFVPVEISAKLVRPGTCAVMVADRGRGIGEEAEKKIYDLFYTTKTTGSGLGLSLAKRYAELFGGTLRHGAREGGGTIFILELPLAMGRSAA